MAARRRLLAFAASVFVAATLVPRTAAHADSIDDKRKEAAQITDRIEKLGDKAADLGEAWNGAQLDLAQAQTDVQQATDKLNELQAKLGGLKGTMADFAVRSYVYADQTGGVVGLLAGTSLTDGAAQREGYQTVALGAGADATDDVKALVQDTQQEQQILADRTAKAQKAADVVAARQRDAQAALDEQQQLLTKVNGELATLVTQEQQRRVAASAAAAAAAQEQLSAAQAAASTAPATSANGTAAGSSATNAPATTAAPATTVKGAAPAGATATTAAAAKPTATTAVKGAAPAGATATTAAAAKPTATTAAKPAVTTKTTTAKASKPATPAVAAPSVPSSPGASVAIKAAMSQLGVAYRFAAASPGAAFDCSGLTMWAWGQAGVSLPHFAAAQYASLPHVPLDAMQPGDLVFFYGDIHHVGIYLGGGMMIHAPRTGDVVKVAAVGPNAIGAARP